MEHREKKMNDAYKNAKPKGKGMVAIGGFNNQAVLQYSQNNFIQNKPQFSTFYGQGNISGPTSNSVGGVNGNIKQIGIQNALVQNTG